MKRINILESLLSLDKKTSNKYELATLYEACKLEDADKEKLVQYIDSYEHPSIIGQYLESKCEGMCYENCDDDDYSELEDELTEVKDIYSELYNISDEDDDKEELKEEIVIENSRAAQKYVWQKVKDIDALTDDDSSYWEFDNGVREGDSAKIITDEIDIPDDAFYKFSLIDVDINMYYSYDEGCWYVLDKTYVVPVVEESVDIHECPVCGRNFTENELEDDACPRCKEYLIKTDSGEYVYNDINEGLEKDLEKRYVASVDSVMSEIDKIKNHELVDTINVVEKYGKEMFELISTQGDKFFLLPVTMSQVDVYDDKENLIDKSEFIKYVPNEILKTNDTEYVYHVVGGPFDGEYSREELTALPCFSGKNTEDMSDIRARGGFVHRPELDNQPELEGYIGPMMDGWQGDKMIIRYETQEIYDMLSEAIEVESDYNNHCPHCVERTLQTSEGGRCICDECATEFEVIPQSNGKYMIIELDEINEGILNDLKKVGKTVGEVAKDRWNDSYTKAIATGIKKNFQKSRLGQDMKRIGDSIKDTDTYKKVSGRINDAKEFIKTNKHDDGRKGSDISMNVRGKDYRVSDLKFKMDGKDISSDEVAKMSAFERRKVKVIVPRGAKPLSEGFFSDDDVEDDYLHSNVYGGDLMYCPECGEKKVWDEDGFAYCENCNR